MKILIAIISFLISFTVFPDVSTFGIIGDAGNWNANSKSVRDSLIIDRVTNLILPGDNIYDLNLDYEDIWKNWIIKGFKFPVVAIGNHTKGYAEEMRFFSMPDEFYSKHIENIHFIVLNSDNNRTAQQQAAFLKTELENSRNKFIFIVYHHPPFSIRHQWQERKDFQLATRPILIEFKEKITAVLVGHDHIASLIQMDTIPVIVSGAVFESFRIPWIDTSLGELGIKTKWSSSGGYYWTRLDVDKARNQVWINFVGTAGERVKCSARIFPQPILLKNNCF